MILCEQMGAEEDVSGLEGFLGDIEVLLEEVHAPRGIAMLQTVTVGAIPHELAIVYLTELVDLPIDNGIVLGTAQAITQGSMNHLAVSQHASLDDGSTETAFSRQTPTPHGTRVYRAWMKLADLQVAINHLNVEAVFKAEGLQRGTR